MSQATESETTYSEQETAKEDITSRRKYLIGPFVFLHTLTLTLYNTSINLYYPYHVGRELFPNESVTKEKSSLCLSRTNSSSTSEQIIQSVVAEYSVYAAISMGFPCLISNILLGSMSDRYGRKQLLIIPSLGLLVAQIIVVLFMYVSVDLYYFLLPSIILAGFGDIFAVFQISLSYVSDITEASKKRTFGIALLELSGGIGVLLGQIIAGYLIQSVGYTLTVLFTCIVKSANLINIVLLPSSVPSTKSQWSCKVAIRSLKESFQFYYSKEFSGSRWKYNLCLIIFIIGNMTVIGRSNVETLYIISSPFCLTPVLVGWFNATKAVMQLTIPMILIRVFLKFWSNEFITVFGAISGLSYFVVETLARSTLTLFLAPVLGFGLVLGFVIIRAIVSVETPGNKQGALYGGLAAIQTIFAFFGTMVFNAIYKNTVHSNKRIFLIFIIALMVVTLIMSIILYMKSRSRNKQYTIKSTEIDIAATENIERY